MTNEIQFTKMNGAGNDFVMFDNRDGRLKFTPQTISIICDRHRGVGADGILLIETSSKADFRMRYYNSDGSEADMCGNGARCFARFTQKTVQWSKPEMSFETGAGLIRATFSGEMVQLNMTAPRDAQLNRKINLSNGEFLVSSLNTGVPHAVYFVEDVEKINLMQMGSETRYHDVFKPKGTNVNFVQKLGTDFIRVRTYERGVEGETLACGTGVTASAILAHLVQKVAAPVKVKVQGGDILEVNFRQAGDSFLDVTLKGPADFTFAGTIKI